MDALAILMMALSNSGVEDAIHRSSDRSQRIVKFSTIVLFTTALLGSFLTGIRVSSFHLFWFRLYLPVYAAIVGWFFWTNRIDTLSVPTAVWLFVGFGAYATVSVAWTISLSETIRWLALLFSALIVGVAVFFTITDRQTLSTYLMVIFVLIACGEVISLVEIYTGIHLHSSRLATDFGPDEVRIGVDMASAWYNNRNNFAFLLALTSGPLLAYSLSAKGALTQALPVVTIALSIFLMWANGVWSALLMVIIALGVVSLLFILRPRFRPWGHSWRQLAALTGAIFFAAVMAIIAILSIPNPFSVGGSFWTRWQLAIAAIELFFQSNGVGVGIGSFPAAVEALSIRTTNTLAPHNWLLYLLGAFGVVGTTLFLMGYSRLLYDLGVKSINSDSTLHVGLFGMLLALPIGALGPSNAVITPEFWLFIALAAAAAYRCTDSNNG